MFALSREILHGYLRSNSFLDALQRNGHETNDGLADLAGLSASQCSRRRAVLEDDGVIEGYHAKLSAEKLGLKVQVFVQVTLA